jgi:large subunit ribosomal protein L9
MKVILLSDQRHLGRRGQEVAVKPGFARNYLMPRQLAVPSTSANRAWFEQQKKKIDAEHAKERDAALEVAAKLASLKLKIAKRVGATETLYGSVTSGDIVGLLKAQGIDIDKRRIELPHGLKTLGEHVVPIELHSDITAELTVQIVSADAG